MAELKTSNTDTIVKIILVFFISLLSFSIGTFVGKKFSDNQHKLSTMEPTKNEDNNASVGSTDHATAEESLSDDQVSALANEFVDDESKSAGKNESAVDETGHAKEETAIKEEPKDQATTHATENAKNEPAKHETPKHEIAKHDSSVKEKEPKSEEINRIPSSIAKEKAAINSTKFTIQIASYPTEADAQKKVDELKKVNFEAFYTHATIKGQTWYRVNVGTYATTKEATDNKAELVEKAHVNSAIIQKITQ
jgi:cell division septation protein DedD